MSRTKFSAEEINSWPKGTKKCWGCKELKALGAFHVMKQGLFGVNTYCKECRKPKSRESYRNTPIENLLWQRAKARARKFGREFSIVPSDIYVPPVCPIFGTTLARIPGETDNSPSLDRIDPNRGYTPDNIVVMSHRANTLKNNASLWELQQLINWMENNASSVHVRVGPNATVLESTS